MDNTTERVALVTGANRGIGFEVCRQLARQGFAVILGARDSEKGIEAAGVLAGEGLNVVARRLDVTDQKSIGEVRLWTQDRFGKLDVLVNNAAVLYDSWQRAVGADLEVVREAFETNTLGPWRVCEAFLPLLRRSRHGRVVNVSSESGSLAGMGGGTPAYSVSKVALNALTRMLADELRGDRILVNSVCPGWVATEMGGPDAPRTAEEGAAGVVWAATLPDAGPTGGFFRDGEPLPW
jgi:NAD(P)-dependent dehydrogenase (short-subunit alcohol dehydrogenase family)